MILPIKLYTLRSHDSDYTRFENISQIFKDTIITTEDVTFHYHNGFDFRMIYNCLKANIKNRSFKNGASTISMQLSKNLYFNFKKTIFRKLKEAVATVILERELTKDQILEFYLNIIYFGNAQYGITNACRFYFNCTPAQLSIDQSIILATIIPGPTYLNPLTHPDHFIKRRNNTLKQLQLIKMIDSNYAEYTNETYTDKTLCNLFDIQGDVLLDQTVPLENPLAKKLLKRARRLR